MRKIFESKFGVVKGESLADDMEGCGEELVLKRMFAPGGGWPKDSVEIIRSVKEETFGAIGNEKNALDVSPICAPTATINDLSSSDAYTSCTYHAQGPSQGLSGTTSKSMPSWTEYAVE